MSEQRPTYKTAAAAAIATFHEEISAPIMGGMQLVDCGACGCTFGVSVGQLTMLRTTAHALYCPAGCRNHPGPLAS